MRQGKGLGWEAGTSAGEEGETGRTGESLSHPGTSTPPITGPEGCALREVGGRRLWTWRSRGKGKAQTQTGRVTNGGRQWETE
jgi:hypothetical protein